MSKREDRELICDIKESIRSIEAYTNRMSYKRFIRDKKTQDAVARNLEIIGEAVKAVSGELKKQHPEIQDIKTVMPAKAGIQKEFSPRFPLSRE